MWLRSYFLVSLLEGLASVPNPAVFGASMRPLSHLRTVVSTCERPRRRRDGLFLYALLFCCNVASADKVDDYIRVQMQKQHVPGLSLAVVKDGKILKAKGYGVANIETNTPATPNTVYRIASISKQFLATGILLLKEEGKLNLDAKISKYLEGTPEGWKNITVRHLLTHTSGLIGLSPTIQYYQLQLDADAIKGAYPAPLLFAPGEKFLYSNLGYQILAEIIHKVSGKPWSEFLRERIFAPAGMTATRPTSTTDIVFHRASGYEWNGNKLENAENWVNIAPSGAYLSTVLDMAKWDAALYTDSILKSSLRAQMWTPVKLNDGTSATYGFGWHSESWQGHRRVHHSGNLPGFESDFERFVDDRLSIIVMLNSTGSDVEGLALHIAGFYLPALIPKPIPDRELQITAKLKPIIAGFVSGDLDMSLFSPDLVASLNADGKAFLSEVLRSPGVIHSITLVERYNLSGDNYYRYRLSYRNESTLLLFVFNKDGKITRIVPNQE